MFDSQHQWDPSASHVHWCLNECNCCHSLCEDNQSRWILHITICDQQSKGGNDQTAEHSKTGIGSSNTRSRASWVPWERDDNNQTSKHIWTDSTATLGWTQSKQRQKMYIANRLTKFTRILTPTIGDIPGKRKPADHGTRGLNPSDIPKLWLQPPLWLLEFRRIQWSPHLRYTSDTTSDAGHWGWKIFNMESTTQLY